MLPIAIAAGGCGGDATAVDRSSVLDAERRQVILEYVAATQSPVITTPGQAAALRLCAGDDLVEQFESDSASVREQLTDDQRDQYFDCVVQEDLVGELVTEVDVSNIPGLVEIHNRETQIQVDCLASKGWAVQVLPADMEGLEFWEPVEDVFDEAGNVLDDFSHAADECVIGE